MSLDRLFGSPGLELSRDNYINECRWINQGSNLRVSVTGPKDYKNFMFMGKEEADKFLQSFDVSGGDLSVLEGNSAYTAYREGVLIGVARK